MASHKPKKSAKGEKSSGGGDTASKQIDQRIASLADWRGETLERLRQIIRTADAEIVEEWKWENPVWSCAGIICTGETYKSTVKLTFAKGGPSVG